MDKKTKADEYIKNNSHKISNQPAFHLIPPIGWMNDPNGFSMFQGEYHLFYQHYPYDTQWNFMHWGHAKSKDLIQWQHLPVALAPDCLYDFGGCFSGSAIEKDGKLYVMYTGHLDPNLGLDLDLDQVRQNQNIAISEDGLSLKKYRHNPVLDEKSLPSNAQVQDFRDPKIFKKEDKYYAVIASKHMDTTGQILLYESEDMLEWTFVSVLAKCDPEAEEMWECPDCFELDGQDVLIVSAIALGKQQDTYRCAYRIGKIDDKYVFNEQYVASLDMGFDFYAPQSMLDDKGRRLLVGWLQMSDTTLLPKHGWAGMMSLPRELYIREGKLYQRPIDELKKYRRNRVNYSDEKISGTRIFEGVHGNCIECEIHMDALNATKFGLSILKNDDCETLIYYDKEQGQLIFDRTNSGIVSKDREHIKKIDVDLIQNQLKLRVFIDRISVEIFVNDGEYVLSSTVFPLEDASSIEFFSDDGIQLVELNHWTIITE